jgi:hypothetical protein
MKKVIKNEMKEMEEMEMEEMEMEDWEWSREEQKEIDKMHKMGKVLWFVYCVVTRRTTLTREAKFVARGINYNVRMKMKKNDVLGMGGACDCCLHKKCQYDY